MNNLYERQARQDENLRKLADNGEQNHEEPTLYEGEP